MLSPDQIRHVVLTLRNNKGVFGDGCGECIRIADLLDDLPEDVVVDKAGFHSCDQACCAKIPGKYCADDDCNCGLAGNHATLPPA